MAQMNYIIECGHSHYPIFLAERMGKDAPEKLFVIGRPELINLPKTALSAPTAVPAMRL